MKLAFRGMFAANYVGVRLEFAHRFIISPATQTLVVAVVNVLADKPNRPITEQEMRSPDVLGFETLTGVPVIRLATGAVGRIDGLFPIAIDGVIDRSGGRDPRRVHVIPTIDGMVPTVWANLSSSNRIRRTIGNVAKFRRPSSARDDSGHVPPVIGIAMARLARTKNAAPRVIGGAAATLRVHLLRTHT